MNLRNRLVTALPKSDEFCWPLENYFENLLFLYSITSATDWCHSLCSSRTTRSSSRTDFTPLPACSWQPHLAGIQTGGRCVAAGGVCAAHDVGVCLTHVQATAGEAAVISGSYQQTITTFQSKAKSKATSGWTPKLPTEEGRWLLADSHQLQTNAAGSFMSGNCWIPKHREERMRKVLNKPPQYFFLHSVWCISFTLATGNVCAL